MLWHAVIPRHLPLQWNTGAHPRLASNMAGHTPKKIFLLHNDSYYLDWEESRVKTAQSRNRHTPAFDPIFFRSHGHPTFFIVQSRRCLLTNHITLQTANSNSKTQNIRSETKRWTEKSVAPSRFLFCIPRQSMQTPVVLLLYACNHCHVFQAEGRALFDM